MFDDILPKLEVDFASSIFLILIRICSDCENFTASIGMRQIVEISGVPLQSIIPALNELVQWDLISIKNEEKAEKMIITLLNSTRDEEGIPMIGGGPR